MSPEIVAAALGGFISGFGAAFALVRIFIAKALAEFQVQMRGPGGFLPRDIGDERHVDVCRRLDTLEDSNL